MSSGNVNEDIPDKNTVPPVKSLQLLLMGPGGTGETRVVNVLQDLMSRFGCEHKIRFLALMGTAASLIDGTTIHSGLKIPINKGNTSLSNLEHAVGQQSEAQQFHQGLQKLFRRSGKVFSLCS